MKIDLAKDFRDLLRTFIVHEVRFLVVGAYALGVHGRPRGTGDLDVWVEASSANAQQVLLALNDFGAPLHDLTQEDLATPGVVFQIGLPPLRIDILTQISGVEFGQAWTRRAHADFEGIRVPVIGREDFVVNKRASGRTKDLADLERLEPLPPRVDRKF